MNTLTSNLVRLRELVKDLFKFPFPIPEDTSVDKRRFLKIKLKSLAAESKIIRTEERRLRNRARVLKVQERLGEDLRKSIDDQREATYRHRIDVVRHEARHTHLAYGLLRGRTRSQIETTSKAIDWNKVETMVRRYGTAEAVTKFEEWKTS